MTRLVKKHPAFFSVTAFLLLLPLVVHLARMHASAVAAPPPPETASLASMMIRAGLPPEALSAVGVTANQVAGIVAAFEGAVEAEPTRLGLADAAYSAAKAESDRLRRLIESGRGNPSDVLAYQNEMSNLAIAEAERAAALADFRADAIAGLQGTPGTPIAKLLANHGWEVPLQFKIADRSEVEWVKLRQALADERICARYGEEPDPALASFLATERAKPAIAQAKAGIDTHGPAVKTAWDNAVKPN